MELQRRLSPEFSPHLCTAARWPVHLLRLQQVRNHAALHGRFFGARHKHVCSTSPSLPMFMRHLFHFLSVLEADLKVSNLQPLLFRVWRGIPPGGPATEMRRSTLRCVNTSCTIRQCLRL